MGLCLALSFSSYSNAQQVEFSTGNIVLPTEQGAGTTPWVNGVYQNNLTCWAGGDPGYCGPNAIVRPGNNINFSYGSTYVYQQQLVSNILPASTGLRVDGYTFSFTAKNGNGWDDGRTDSLIALVRFWDNTGGRGAGSLLYGNVYDLNRKFNWTNFSYNETFKSPFDVPSIGHVQYGFIGRDNNGWAGPYGPEVNNVSFTMKYSVDPCANDPLASPSCPGYSSALLSSIQENSPVKVESTTTAVSQPSTQPSLISEVASVSVIQSPASSSTVSVATAAVSASNTGAPADPVSSAMSPPDPAPQPGAVSANTSTSSTNTSSSTKTSSGPSKTAMNAVKQVAAANQQLTASINQQAVSSSAARITASQIQSNLIVNQVLDMTASSGSSQQASTSQSNSMAMFGFAAMPGASSSATQSSTQQTVALANPSYGPSASASSQGNVSGSLQPQASFTGNGLRINQNQQSSSQISQMEFAPPATTPSSSSTISTPQQNEKAKGDVEVVFTLPMSNITGRTNFVSDPTSGAQLPLNTESAQQTESNIKQNVQQNELAGVVDIGRMAVVPAGYQSYEMALKDVPFYAPKEIYKNQKNSDNVRLLRGLSSGSDRLHQQMMEQQYKTRN